MPPLAFLDKQGARIKEMDGREIDWKLDVARIILRANQIERFGDILKNRRGDLDPSFAKTLDEGDAVDVVHAAPGAGRSHHRLQVGAEAVRRLRPAADADRRHAGAARHPGPVRAAGGRRQADRRPALRLVHLHHPLQHDRPSGDQRFPFGRSKAGLPIGIHFVAPWYAEAHLIKLAEAFDAETDASAEFPPGFAAGA